MVPLGDGVGDACQGDSDGDGTPNDQDASPLNKWISSTDLVQNFNLSQEIKFRYRVDDFARTPKWDRQV